MHVNRSILVQCPVLSVDAIHCLNSCTFNPNVLATTLAFCFDHLDHVSVPPKPNASERQEQRLRTISWDQAQIIEVFAETLGEENSRIDAE